MDRLANQLCSGLLPAMAIAGLMSVGPTMAEQQTRSFRADLTADGETAVVESSATASADLTLEIPEHRLSWTVAFQGLDAQVLGIGLHGPVQKGSNGIIMVELGPKGAKSPVRGSAVLNDAQVEYMLSGWTYVDIRTARYPTGEIRGQVRVLRPERSEP